MALLYLALQTRTWIMSIMTLFLEIWLQFYSGKLLRTWELFERCVCKYFWDMPGHSQVKSIYPLCFCMCRRLIWHRSRISNFKFLSETLSKIIIFKTIISKSNIECPRICNRYPLFPLLTVIYVIIYYVHTQTSLLFQNLLCSWQE